MKIRKIFYTNTTVHTYLKSMFNNPPKGYEYVVNVDEGKNKLINSMRNSKLMSYLYKKVVKKIFNVQPLVNLVYSARSPENTDLILSTGALIKEDKPWVLLVLDSIYSVAGMDYNLFIKNKEKIRNSLESKNCKAIIVHSKDSEILVKKHFPTISKKAILVTPGIPLKDFNFKYKEKEKDFYLLFMGSINNPHEFLIKGGLEALKVFKNLKSKYPKIKLIMKCIVPEEYKKKYFDKDIIFIDNFVSDREVDEIYAKSDILLSTGCGYFIMAYFESFSHGLPIIAYKTFGVSDFIKNGENGFLIEPSKSLLIKTKDYPANVRSNEFQESIKNVEDKTIDLISKKVEILIKNEKKRKKMRKETLKIFKKKFSIESQNKQMKKVFDEALR